MDKKNLTIGILFFLAAFVILRVAPHAPQPAPSPDRIANPFPANQAGAAANAPSASPSDATFAALQKDAAGETITHLANDFIDVAFTDYGGAIKDVALRKFPAEVGRADPYVFNALHVEPMLAFVDFPGLDDGTRYTLVSQTEREIVFRAVFENHLEVTRRYVLEPSDTKTGDPYQLRHETVFRNLKAETTPLPRLTLSLGTAAPVNFRDLGFYLDTGYSDGNSVSFIARAKLQGGSFFGFNRTDPLPFIETLSPIAWATVQNQFFTSILTPDEPGTGLITRRIELPPFPNSTVPDIGITGSALFDVKPLAPNGEIKLGMDLYVGPKEYSRLANADIFKHDQDKVMQFGKVFGFFSELLLKIMSWVHSWAHNWGLAIVITTLAIKTIFLPLSFAMARSARRMQKIQPLLQALREKYKGNPQKLNEGQLALFKEHKVNPLAGCLPMLIQLPFFFGFFAMLRSASELRLAPFLWVQDLSAPDTIGHINGFAINILPLLMGATMISQMFLVPQPATMDKTQAKMMRFMPLMYVVFCYNYSCALALYSTINSLFTIGQQILINRMKDDGDPTHAPAGGKPIKNVTPQKKK
ncbi:MAG TPA: YidC/Oxa1 family insertase periplasmic-domain containing protein [Opitutaceae bacterium]|jgi:YidC/Oxa1 family membrane protein insertase|nr:YidC/Oxa1 family insertase periplasmic-domain containing protein [Opitutaceae bacterium]